MRFFNLRTLIKSLGYALGGLVRAFHQEQNFRIQVLTAVIVFVLILVLPVTRFEAALVILVVMAVLVIELVNTIFEAMLDLLKPRLNHYAAVVKDLMAAAVFLASLGALFVELLIFLPYLLGGRR